MQNHEDTEPEQDRHYATDDDTTKIEVICTCLFHTIWLLNYPFESSNGRKRAATYYTGYSNYLTIGSLLEFRDVFHNSFGSYIEKDGPRTRHSRPITMTAAWQSIQTNELKR